MASPIDAIMRGVLLMCWARLGLATVYIVGDASGWTTGVDYSLWTCGKTFLVGDTLVFYFAPNAHSVHEVPSKSYQSCSTHGSVSADNNGSTAITLATEGMHFFLCGIAGHCSSGMKLAINVQATLPLPSTPDIFSPPTIITPMPFITYTPTYPLNIYGAARETKVPATAVAGLFLLAGLLFV